MALAAALGAAWPAAADVTGGPAVGQVQTAQARLAALEAEILALIEQERNAEADALLATLLDLEIATYGPHDWRVANSHGFRADLAESVGDMAAGERHRRREIEVLTQGEDAARLGSAQIGLALNLATQSRQAEALSLLDAAEATVERASDPRDPRIQAALARAHVLTSLGRQAEAEALLARADQAQAGGAPSSMAARLAHALAVARSDLDRPAEAEEPARRACALADGFDPPDLQIVASACLVVARSLDHQDRRAEAAPFARRAMEAHQALGAESILRSGHVVEATDILIETTPEAEREPFFQLRLAALASGEDEADQESWAQAANALGLWLTAHDRAGEAVGLLRRSLAIYEARSGLEHRNTAIVRANLVDALLAVGEAGEAEALALGLLPLLIDEPDMEGSQFVLARALTGQPQALERLILAMSVRRDARGAPTLQRVDLYSQLANLASDRFDWSAALGWRRKAVEALRDGHPEEPGLSLAIAFQGRAMLENGDYAGAYEALSAAWSRLEPMDIPGPDRFYVARHLADVALEIGRADEAERLNTLALAGYRATPDATQAVIGTLMGRSDILIARSDLGGAEATLAEAMALARREDDAGDTAAIVESAQSALWKMQGRYDEAEAAMRRAVDYYGARFGPDALQNAVPLKNLAQLLEETEKPDRALPLLRQAAAIEARHLPPDSPEALKTHVRIAALMGGMGRAEEALVLLTDLAERADAALGPGHRISRHARERVGWALAAQERFAEAGEHFQRAVFAAEDVYGPDDYALMGPLQALAYAYYMDGRMEDTLQVMRRTVEVGERGGARWPRSLSQVKANLGMTLMVLGRPREALVPLRDAAEIRRQGLIRQAASGTAQIDPDRYPFRRLVQAAYRTAAEAD